MTEDLVKRLREAADEIPSPHETWAPVMREAADEIEKLRKYVVSAVEKIADVDAALERIDIASQRVRGAIKRVDTANKRLGETLNGQGPSHDG